MRELRLKLPKSYMFVSYYTRRNYQPNPFTFVAFYLLFFAENPLKLFHIFRETRNLKRIYKSLRLPVESTIGETNAPKIELLSVAAGKDISILPLSLESAIKNSLNPVELITIIVPSHEVQNCHQTLQPLNFKAKLQILDENEYYSADEIEALKKKFGTRFGWVFQQFLALKHIRSSNFKGVLLLNSDTIILNQTLWLSQEKRQILMVSIEYHAPYYEVLSKLIKSPVLPKYTFITHHMLFQPDLLRRIFKEYEIESESKLLCWVLNNVKSSLESSMCLEFELYAQGILSLNPELVELLKFANISMSRSSESVQEVRQILSSNTKSVYNSVSMHDYINF